MHGVSPSSAAHETLLRFSVSGGDRSALVALLLSSPGVGPTENYTGDLRSFATAQRVFILEPTAGGDAALSNATINPPAADLSIILVDASAGLTPEVRRHVAMARGIGSRHLVLAVDTQDYLGWDRAGFQAIAKEFTALAATLDFGSAIAIPISLAKGDNVAAASANTPWYKGPTLLPHLERVRIDPARKERSLRLPITSVSRPDPDHRRYLGTIASGALRRGDTIQVAISGVTSTVDHIFVEGIEREQADAGESIAIGLSSHIDVGSGDMLVHPEHPPLIAEQFAAHLVWIAEEPLFPGRDYSLRMGAREVAASVTSVKHRIDIEYSPIRSGSHASMQRDWGLHHRDRRAARARSLL